MRAPFAKSKSRPWRPRFGLLSTTFQLRHSEDTFYLTTALMAAAYVSDSEEDLPTLDEFLSRRRIPTKLPAIVLQQQKTTVAVSVTPNRVTTAVNTSKIPLQSPSNTHSTPTRRSSRLSSPVTAPPHQQATPITCNQINDPSSSARRRSLADELFPPFPPSAPSPQPAFTARADLYSYREPSPSIISDSEPDLPSPAKFRRSANGEESAKVLERKMSRESFWVEDSEDERVQQELEAQERRG